MSEPKRAQLSTDKQVQALKSEDRPYEHAIKASGGLRIKVAPTGRKSWIYRYRNRLTGALERMVLGQYPDMTLADAREETPKQRAIVNEHGSARQFRNVDRAAKQQALAAKVDAARQAQFTVERMINQYLSDASNTLKSWREVERALQKYVIPDLGRLPADQVSRKDVIGVLSKLTKAGKRVMANRTLAYLRRCFNWAIRKDLITTNPCVLIERHKEQPKERYLNDTELGRFLRWLPKSDLDDPIQDLCRLIILTGMRPGEAARLSFDDFDEEAAIIRLNDTKNGRTHVIPANAAVATILKARRSECKWVFPMRTDSTRPMRSDMIPGALKTALSTLEIIPFTAHDLRRTFATGLARIGTPRLLISLALNHAVPGVTSVYDRHGYEADLRKWYEAWAEHVERLTLASGPNTVKMPDTPTIADLTSVASETVYSS